MGCDIHMFREVYRNDRWECLEETYEEEDWGSDSEGTLTHLEDLSISRNYWLFGLLAAGVRTEWEFSWQPRGLPNDVSELVKAAHEQWGSDPAVWASLPPTASWLGMAEIQQKALELLILPGQEAPQCGKLLADLINKLEWPAGIDPGDCRIVFWFDN